MSGQIPPRGVDTLACRGLRERAKSGQRTQLEFLKHTSPDRGHCLSMRKIQNDRSEPRPPVIENAQKEGEEAVVVKADGDAGTRPLPEQEAGGGEGCAVGRARRGSVPRCGGWASRESRDPKCRPG